MPEPRAFEVDRNLLSARRLEVARRLRTVAGGVTDHQEFSEYRRGYIHDTRTALREAKSERSAVLEKLEKMHAWLEGHRGAAEFADIESRWLARLHEYIELEMAISFAEAAERVVGLAERLGSTEAWEVEGSYEAGGPDDPFAGSPIAGRDAAQFVARRQREAGAGRAQAADTQAAVG